MTDIPQYNAPAFEQAAKELRDRGHEVTSPPELDNGQDGSVWDFIARDLKIIASDAIEAVVVLPGWQNSKGARLEVLTALMLKKQVYYFYTWTLLDPEYTMRMMKRSIEL